MIVLMAVYLASVSLAYALLAKADPGSAHTLTVAFVALLLVPSAVHDVLQWRRNRGR